MADFKPIECNPENYKLKKVIEDISSEAIKTRLLNAYEIIHPFAAILDCEMIQFFNRNHWDLLPPDWRDCLTKLSINELADLMDCGCPLSTSKLPPELSTIRQSIKYLSLPRGCHKYHRLSPITATNLEDLQSFRELYNKSTSQLPFYSNLMSFDKRRAPLSLLRYKCKDKKLSEILVMGDLCFKASLVRKVDFIVDIGAGLGHLSRCLAYFYGIDVVTIERDGKMTEEALRLDQKFLKILKSFARKDPKYDHIPQAKIFRIAKEITPTLTADGFLNLINEAVKDKDSKLGNFKFGLVGLHPCGNLAPTMLNFYKNCKNCKFINIASCCYNKMTTVKDLGNDQNRESFIGFPLNQLRKAGEGVTMYMGKNELGLALHALETYQERFRLPTERESFKADFYRALVEKFIQDVAPEFRETRRKNVKTIGPGGVTSFREYLNISIPEMNKNEQNFKERYHKIDTHLSDINEEVNFHRIMAFSAFRHMFAPLLETIVLLDRLLYLKNVSSHCHVTQRFEPHVSPRVHVITAFKQS